MSGQVLATAEALQRVSQLRQVLEGPLQRTIRDLLGCGETLSRPDVWSGPGADVFRASAWPRTSSAVRRVLEQLEQLQSSSSGIISEIMAAGAVGAAAAPLGAAVASRSTSAGAGSVAASALMDAAMSGAPARPSGRVERQVVAPPDAGGDPGAPTSNDVAAELADAANRHDLRALRRALDDLKGHEDDPTYAAGVFQTLGPAETAKVMSAFAAADTDPADDQRVALYDTALATFTNSPAWDPSWNATLWPHGDPAQTPDPAVATLLLSHGAHYSADFLKTAADSILFSPLRSDAGPVDPGYDPVHAVLENLAANPSVDLDYLLGQGMNPVSPTTPRIQVLLEAPDGFNQSGPGQGLADAIAAAAGPSNPADRVTVLLQQIAALPGVGEPTQNPTATIPDPVKAGIADAISENLDDFADLPPQAPGDPPPWQEKLFIDAELAQDGSLIQANVKSLQDAIGRWQNANVPSDLADNPDTTVWMERVGTLSGLAAYPQGQSKYDQQALQKANEDLLTSLLSLASSKVPLPASLPGQVAAQLLPRVEKVAASWVTQGPPWANTNGNSPSSARATAYYNDVGSLRTGLAAAWLQAHPEDLPPSLQGSGPQDPQWQDYVSWFATASSMEDVQGDPTWTTLSPEQQHDLGDLYDKLGTASQQFSNQYWVPDPGSSTPGELPIMP